MIPIGARFERLTVIRPTRVVVSPCGTKRQMYAVVCDCGVELEVRDQGLTSSNTRSCGCLQRERTSAATKKHGQRYNKAAGIDKSSVYRHWLAIKSRCERETDKDYPRYGARGIYVADEWQDFSRFAADVGDHPKGMSIDRPDNNGPYAPWNWRWATDETQANNRRSTLMLTFNGVTKALSEWARSVGLSRNTLYLRIKTGWSVDRALTEPYDKRRTA